MQLTDHINDLALHLRGNWKKFGSFIWLRDDIEDEDNWCIVYTHNRDSGLLEESNAQAIAKIMQPHLEGNDILAEDHNHWGYGWIAGYSIRVYRLDWNGINTDIESKYTPAFLEWYKIQERMNDYPLLDEDDYSAREYETCMENITSTGNRLVEDGSEEIDWVSFVYTYLSQEYPGELENRCDDQGAYPSEEIIAEALYFHGLLDEAYLHLINITEEN